MHRTFATPLLLVILAAVSAAVLVEPVSAGGGACHRAPDEREGTGDRVLMTANCFSPTVLRVEAGTNVVFRNNDMAEHHVAGVASAWGTDWGKNLAGESSITFRFDAAGTYPYSCYIHLGMSGVIVVGDGSFAAQPRSSGGVQPVSHAVAAPDQVQQRLTDSAPAALAAATPAEVEASGNNGLLMALLGAIVGGVTVAAAFSARGIRRG